MTFPNRSLGFLAVLTLSISCLVGGPTASAADREFVTPLPLVHVVTGGKEIGKEEVDAKVSFLNGADNRSRDLLQLKPEMTATINVRGYSSSHLSKHQFELEFQATGGKKKDAAFSFLGLPPSSKWVLAAPYLDRSLIRNALAFAMARSLAVENGKPWYAPRTMPIELFIDGKYQGVYFLTEKIDGSKERLGLDKTNWEEPEQSAFMVKVEKNPRLKPEEHFHTVAKSNVAYYEPKAKKLAEHAEENPAQAKRMISHIQSVMNRFEQSVLAINQGDFKSYRDQIEPESFMNFILIQEVFKNLDGFRRSLLVHYKDGQLHMGPIWDFDLTMANIRLFGEMSPEGFQVGHDFYIDANPEQFWFRTMLRDPAFSRALIHRYESLRARGQPLGTDTILGLIERLTGELGEAPDRNFTAWDPNGKFSDGPLRLFIPKYRPFRYESVVAGMEVWVRHRLDWLDRNIHEIGRLPVPVRDR